MQSEVQYTAINMSKLFIFADHVFINPTFFGILNMFAVLCSPLWLMFVHYMCDCIIAMKHNSCVITKQSFILKSKRTNSLLRHHGYTLHASNHRELSVANLPNT